MDCNREEALRSKDLAENKLASQDYHGARKFLQKALQIFPALENTSQISAVIDVHIAAQVKVTGTEMDWYGILQVDQGADDIVIKKQFKKLALLLHPDKNKYAGAEAAFKLIGEALQVLSDRQQRMLYDSRRKLSGRVGHTTQKSQSRQTASQMYANRPAAPLNTFITVCPCCHTRYQYYRVYQNQNLLCHQCGLPFIAREYFPASNGTYSAYGWHHFSQAQPGYNSSSQPGYNSSSFQQFASAANFTSGMPYTSDPVHGGAQKSGVSGGVPTPDYANQMPNDKAHMESVAEEHKRKRKDEKDSEREMRKMEREQQKKAKADQRAQEALEREAAKRRKQAEKAAYNDRKKRSKKQLSESSEEDDDDDDDDDDEDDADSESGEDFSDVEILNQAVDSESAPRRSSRPKRNVTYRVDVSDDEEIAPEIAETHSPKDVDNREAPKATQKKASERTIRNTNVKQDGVSAERQRLAELAKGKILFNLAKSIADMKAGAFGELNNGKLNEVDQSSQEGRSQVGPKSGECVFEAKTKMEPDERSANVGAKNKVDDQGKEVKDTPSSPGTEAKDVSVEEEEGEAYVLPDPEFGDFDADRNNVRAGQVWASYDDVESLPRFYLKVKEVMSLDPFRVSISWLELRSLSADQQSLKRLGFLPTCGNNFKTTSSQTLDAVDMLSHILKWEKGPKGTVIIYPRRGDIWALYRNWKPGLRPGKKSVLQEYEMVEVLTDFDNQVGVSVARLEKLPEHKTLFKRSKDRLEVTVSEVCKFSHQVPAYQLQENEAPGNEKGCWELDPASVPLTDTYMGSGESKS